MSTHDGHRKRLRDRYRKEGLDNFEPHEVLELLLTYAIPRRDTNAIAHTLINSFGSLANVFEARAEQLCQVAGVGENAAVLLSMFSGIGRQYQLSKLKGTVFETTEQMARYCVALKYGRPYETLHMICLNTKKRLVAQFLLEEGTLDNVAFHVTKIVERAMGAKARSVVITHNHPGGEPLPSEKDVRATFVIARALGTVDIKFEDHIIIGDEEKWVSLRESKVI